MNQIYRTGTTVLLVLMCFLSVGMLFGLATYGWDAPPNTNLRFLTVASVPLACIAVVLVARRKQVASSVQLGVIAIAFVAFIGLIDFANGRQLYSGLRIFWKA